MSVHFEMGTKGQPFRWFTPESRPQHQSRGHFICPFGFCSGRNEALIPISGVADAPSGNCVEVVPIN
jgi:hypothetical protein